MSSKHKNCPRCNGAGRIYIYRNGTAVDSYSCTECNSTGKVPRKKGE